ncbi:MAG: hypothetical protein KME04_18350 [Pleurocapsa minor GSE-CHR-MK-17-07R]|jgi:hypothetical protein|nr:hypothetical protein [Pleurocapsa minor GSE-CHR-MK 17-07R]
MPVSAETSIEKQVTRTHSQQTVWGWLPILSLSHAVALVFAAIAYTASRNNAEWGTPLFWFSLILIFAPAALRVASPSIRREERLGLIVITGMALYMVKVLHSPVNFTFHDEFLHWRTASDILLSGRLFVENPILTVSPLYPGLEIITTAFSNLSGLNVFDSGIISLGVARLAFMLALYLFYERAGRSSQLGGIAALLYMGNSNFLFFGSQYAYETLSLPLATSILIIVIIRDQFRQHSLLKLLILTVPILATIAITHHLTAYALIGLLSVLMITTLIIERRVRKWLPICMVIALAVGLVIAWTNVTGDAAREYLGPVLAGGVSEFIALIMGDQSGRQLFQGATGQVSPIWERVVGVLSIVAILVVLPIGLLQVWRSRFRGRHQTRGVQLTTANSAETWPRYRINAVAVAFAIVVFIYPIMLGFRFTSAGWELANRSSEFVFWALGYIIGIGALAIGTYRRFRIPARVWTFGFAVWATIIFLGGSIAGWPPWARMPGTYLVSADTRSVEARGIAAAQWAGQHLDPQDRIAADRVNTLLLATYGQLFPVTHQYDGIYLSPIFVSEEIGFVERQLMQLVSLRYVLVDDRLTTALPRVGVYFEAGEPNANEYVVPLALSALTKFDGFPQVSRLFDDGHIRFYDISELP